MLSVLLPGKKHRVKERVAKAQVNKLDETVRVRKGRNADTV